MSFSLLEEDSRCQRSSRWPHEAPDAVRGGVLGLVNGSQSLSIIISTAIGGFLFAMGPYVPNIVSFGVAIGSLVPAFAISRVMHRQVVSHQEN